MMTVEFPTLRSHHLSLPRPFTPNLKLISFTNPFLHSHSCSIQTAFTDLNLYTVLKGHWRLFVFVSFSGSCARLSWTLSFRVHVKLFYPIVSQQYWYCVRYSTLNWTELYRIVFKGNKHMPIELLFIVIISVFLGALCSFLNTAF